MSTTYNNMNDYESQVKKLLEKCKKKKFYNRAVIDWLLAHQHFDYAYAVEDCATFVGFTNVNERAYVTKANFCRKRLCNVCAWRRQSKFVAQTFPVVQLLRERGYRFIFATATVPNVPLEELSRTINRLMLSYDRLLKRRKVKKAWCGKIRALEVTYNAERDDFHPHIHIMIAVRPEYFSDPELYISTDEFQEYWEQCYNSTYDYPLQVRLQAIDDDAKGVVETLKYSFKTSKSSTAIEGFYNCLRGRRLVSFSGVFAQLRKELKYSDFENILTDDITVKEGSAVTYQLYKFDVTGGVYNFWKEYELNV